MARFDIDDDYERQMAKKIFLYVLLGVCVILFFIIIFGSWYTVDAGDRGIILTMGKPSDNIMQPGFHLKIPMVQSLIRTSVRTQTISFDNKQATGDNSEYSSLAAASKDLQDVAIGSVVNYHINEGDVLDIYRKYGTEENYQKNILEPIIREAVKATASQYTAEELVTKRQEFSDRVAKALLDKFSTTSGVFEKYSVVNFEFSSEYATAIEQKAVQAQLLEKSKIELETTKVQADTRIAQAEGEAKAIQIQVSAINQQGGANYVQLQALSHWDGKLPIVMGGNSVPFINLNSVIPAATIASGAVINSSN
jgi:prohibitin 2